MLPIRIFSTEWLRFDLRNHRKIVVVDGELGFTGSQNLIDCDYHKRSNVKKGLYYVELVARVHGPIVQQLNAAFLSDWYAEMEMIFADYLRHTRPVGLHEWRSRPLITKLFDNLARLTSALQ